VNLGRLFLLGEEGVRRDREAGKRLLTLAAESGDADAQMVVGMIHATPAFECYDLRLSEHWLKQSIEGGKDEARKLLSRVSQQIEQQLRIQASAMPMEDGGGGVVKQSFEEGTSFAGDILIPDDLESSIDEYTPSSPTSHSFMSDERHLLHFASTNPTDTPTRRRRDSKRSSGSGSSSTISSSSIIPRVPVSQNAAAAKERGDAYASHGLLHAAVLEYSRAFELDRSTLSYFIDRLESLCALGHHEECIADTALMLLSVDCNGVEYSSSGSSGSGRRRSNSNRNSVRRRNLMMMEQHGLHRGVDGVGKDRGDIATYDSRSNELENENEDDDGNPNDRGRSSSGIYQYSDESENPFAPPLPLSLKKKKQQESASEKNSKQNVPKAPIAPLDQGSGKGERGDGQQDHGGDRSRAHLTDKPLAMKR
jgi:hypothetical protein